MSQPPFSYFFTRNDVNFFFRSTHTNTIYGGGRDERTTCRKERGRGKMAWIWFEFSPNVPRRTKRTRERRRGVLHARASSTIIIDSQKDKISRNISVFFYYFSWIFTTTDDATHTHWIFIRWKIPQNTPFCYKYKWLAICLFDPLEAHKKCIIWMRTTSNKIFQADFFSA